MRFIFRLFVLFLSFSAWGQNDTIAWSEDVLRANKWLPAPENAKNSLYFTARIQLERTSKKIGKSIQFHLYPSAVWLQGESYMTDSLQMKLIPLAQLEFDCYELHARYCFQEVNTDYNDEFQIQNARNKAESNAQALIAEMLVETENGDNSEAIVKWRKKLDQLLSETPNIAIPEYERERFCFGFDLGYANTTLSGNISNLIKSAGGFSYGFTVTYKRLFLDYHASNEFATALDSFVKSDFKFYSSSNLRLKQGQFLIGYSLINTERFSLAPYIGISSFRILNYSEPKGSILRNGPSYLQPVAGIASEYCFDRLFQTNTSIGYLKAYLKAGVGKISYGKGNDGYALLLNLGIGYSLHTIKNTID